MAKLKSGLHKDISTIFDGVPLPGRNDSEIETRTVAKTMPRKATRSVPVKPLSSTGQNLPDKVNYNKTQPQPKTQPRLVTAKSKEQGDAIAEAFLYRIIGWTKSKLPAMSFSYRKVAEAVALAGLMIFFTVRVVAIVGPSSTDSQPTAADDQQEEPFDGNVDWQFPALYPKGLRDPMVTGTTTRLTEPDALKVKGILHSNNNSFAIIGIEIVKVGDVVSGATIIKIEENSVTFKKDEKVWTQKIHR